MANTEIKPFSVYNPEVQTLIYEKIEDYKTKAFQAAIPILFPALQNFQNILMGEGNDENKLTRINSYLASFVRTENDNLELSTKRNSLEEGTDVIAKNIFSHLATKVGLCFTNPTIEGLESFRTFTGLMSASTSPDEVVRFFELRSIPFIDPLMQELRADFADEVLEQYPPVQKSE